jgi:hypothetical protein
MVIIDSIAIALVNTTWIHPGGQISVVNGRFRLDYKGERMQFSILLVAP